MDSTTLTTADEAAEAAARVIAIRRASFIDGLRALADVLEEHDEVPLPYTGTGSAICFSEFLSVKDPRAALAATARAFPVSWTKGTRESEEYGNYFDLYGELHGLKVHLTAYREAVCERVVTGHREVTEKVKDPAKLAEVPEIEVVRTVEDVTWECHSILKPDADESAPVQDTEAA